jgi:hypothetical protein
MRNFKDYNRDEIFATLDKITIQKIEGQVITKFDGRVINITNVSDRYEIFDIVKYLKDKIELIEKNFQISKYVLRLTSGRQFLQLISDKIEIGGVEFYKSFYILNSTDKSRTLSFNLGLQSDNISVVGIKNVGIVKKHLTGVTKAAEDASIQVDHETFNEQIESMRSLVGHRISFSKIREIILGEKEEIPQINHRKFDAFKNVVRWSASDMKLNITKEQRDLLYKDSDRIKEISKSEDFYIDAYWAFLSYLKIFNKQDSHIIKKETERIMKITQWAIRNNALEALGI